MSLWLGNSLQPVVGENFGEDFIMYVAQKRIDARLAKAIIGLGRVGGNSVLGPVDVGTHWRRRRGGIWDTALSADSDGCAGDGSDEYQYRFACYGLRFRGFWAENLPRRPFIARGGIAFHEAGAMSVKKAGFMPKRKSLLR